MSFPKCFDENDDGPDAAREQKEEKDSGGD